MERRRKHGDPGIMRNNMTAKIMNIAVLFVFAATFIGILTSQYTAYALKVKAVVSGSTVNGKTITMTRGAKRKLGVRGRSITKKSIRYKSSRKQIVSVSNTGVLRAKKKGAAKITISAKDKTGTEHKVWFKVKVKSGKKSANVKTEDASKIGTVTSGKEYYEDFLLDNVLHTVEKEDIHYNLYVPQSYDGSKAYALFVTLPGWEGLYFQGVSENLKWEKFGQQAGKYVQDMIVVAPQLDDWEDTSARQAITLTKYFLAAYNIDSKRVYINGYSGGGETLSLVLEKEPELYAAALHISSKWDGRDYSRLIKARTPLYFAIGENDSYYGSEYVKKAYKKLKTLYREAGLTDKEIDKILVLDVKDQKYFTERGFDDQHAGGCSFAFDEDIMGWLFGH